MKKFRNQYKGPDQLGSWSSSHAKSVIAPLDPNLQLLHTAVIQGDCSVVQRILDEQDDLDINGISPSGKTALMLAVEDGNTNAVELLLSRGADVNVGTEHGPTPLHSAVLNGDQHCAEQLLLAGAKVNPFAGKLRSEPLHEASSTGSQTMVALLLRYGGDPNALDKQSCTPLHLAAAGGHAQCVHELIRGGSRVDELDGKGLTPLSVARGLESARELVHANAVLSENGFQHLLQQRPDALSIILDLGVRRDENTNKCMNITSVGDGRICLNYNTLRQLGSDQLPFEAHFIHEVHKTGRWQLLHHAAVEVLLELSRQDSLWLCLSRLIFCYIFLATLLGLMVVTVYHPRFIQVKVALAIIVGILNTVRFFWLLIKLAFVGTKGFYKLRTLPSVMKIVLIYVILFLPQGDTQRIVFAMTSLLAFIELILIMETVPTWKFTRAISSLLLVTRSICEYLLIYLPMLIGFGVAFYVLFDPKNSIFEGRILLTNMAAMMLGEINVEEIDRNTPMTGIGYVVGTIVLVLFVLLVPLVMLNLLLALTVSDTHRLLSKGGSEFLQNMAINMAWNQQAAFSFDATIRKLKRHIPKALYEFLAMWKWRTVLPRSAAHPQGTPVIMVQPFAFDGKRVRACVSGSKRQYAVGSYLRQELEKVLERTWGQAPIYERNITHRALHNQ